MLWCSSEIELYCPPFELHFFSPLILISLLLALLLLLRLKVWPHVVPPLQIWVVPPFCIICVGEGVALPLIIIEIICLLSLLEGKTIRLIIIAFMSHPQKSEDKLV